MTTDETLRVVQLANDAYQAIRAINHITMRAKAPAPLVYDVLGSLKNVGHLLPQALTQLSAGLGRFLDEYDVFEDDGGDSIQSVASAADHLTRAGRLAAQLGEELELAQSAMLAGNDRRRGRERRVSRQVLPDQAHCPGTDSRIKPGALHSPGRRAKWFCGLEKDLRESPS